MRALQVLLAALVAGGLAIVGQSVRSIAAVVGAGVWDGGAGQAGGAGGLLIGGRVLGWMGQFCAE